MNPEYRLVVIGAGSAGLSAASFAAHLGVRVALVEGDRIGGDCTWTGCVPSKALLHAAKLVHQVRSSAPALGLSGSPKADLPGVMARVQEVIDRVYEYETPEALAQKGIDVISGTARFTDPQTLDVNGRAVRGHRVVICTGASPVIPPIPGLLDAPHLTHETVFREAALPPRLLVLGGGPVGVELAQAFQRLGSAVTVIEQANRILPLADPEASDLLAERLRSEGVELWLGRAVERVGAQGSRVTAFVGDKTFEGEALLVAAGRRPRLEALDLPRAGVLDGRNGINVDGHLRTSQRHIYACGDVIGSPQFTHYAAWQGFVAARNALLPGRTRGMRPGIPSVVFTDPEVGQVGTTEREARERGETVRTRRWPVDRIDRAQTADDAVGFLKLITRPDGRLVGATVVAAAASELVNELALAIDQLLTLGDLAATIHAYPTFGFGIQQASAEATYDGLTSGSRGRLIRALARWWP